MPHPATRVVVLYGAFTEILTAMDLTHLMVARTDADDRPPGVMTLPSVGTHMRPNLEMIVGLKPDLVLQMGGRDEAVMTVETIEDLGLQIACYQASSFQDLMRIIGQIGVLCGAQDRADSLIADIRARLSRVRMVVALARHHPTVVYEVRYPNLLVAGQGAMASEIINRAGGRNPVIGDRKIVRLSEEELLRLNPDVYLYQNGPMNPDPVPPQERAHFASLLSVMGNQVFRVDEKAFSRPGPNSINALESLVRAIFPELAHLLPNAEQPNKELLQ